MDRQEDLIKQLESGAPQDSGMQPAYNPPVQDQQPMPQQYPQYSPNPPVQQPAPKRSIFDILTLISYVILGLVGTIIAILLIMSNLR